MLFAASDLSLSTLLPRVFLSMAIVIGVMWVAARFMKNRQVPGSGGFRPSTAKRAPIVQVLARQGVGRHASVTVVRAGDKSLVLGVTDTNVTLLTELDDHDEHNNISSIEKKISSGFRPLQSESHGTGTSRHPAAAEASSARKGLLEQVRERTVRKA